MGPLAVMVPDVWTSADQLHVDWFGLPAVGAEVAATILELLQVFDGVGAAGSGHSAHTKGQRHLEHTNLIFNKWLHLSRCFTSTVNAQFLLVKTGRDEP